MSDDDKCKTCDHQDDCPLKAKVEGRYSASVSQHKDTGMRMFTIELDGEPVFRIPQDIFLTEEKHVYETAFNYTMQQFVSLHEKVVKHDLQADLVSKMVKQLDLGDIFRDPKGYLDEGGN